MFWLLLILFPLTVHAAAVAQPSDVVLLVDGVDVEQQDRYNYLYKVEGEDTFYTCQANRCSLLAFQEQPTVNVTFYQLPEGFQRVTNVVDQTTLAEYANAAAHTYVVTNLETNLEATGNNRTYHTLTVKDDNTFTRDTVSRERNAPIETDVASGNSVWITIGIVALGTVVVVGLSWLAVWLWKRRF